MASRVKFLSVLLFLVGLTYLSGCIFSPERKKAAPPPPDIVYLDPISPVNVLTNLVDAYKARDSVQTAAIYDDAYKGVATDLSLPTQIPQLSKADEIRHVGRLKLDPNIVSVFLDLGAPLTWQVLDASASFPAGFKSIQITNQVVRIEDLFIATTWLSQNRIIEYTFKPTDVPGAPPESDTTWTVVEWKEFAN